MTTVEEELLKLEPVIRGLTNFSLFAKRIIVRGDQHFVKSGPNIIVGNHIGTFKDIATLYRISPKKIFFTANKMIFNREEFNQLVRRHLHRHLKNLGLFVDLLLKPIKTPFVNFISTNIAKAGAIPVNLYQSKRFAIEKCQEYLKEGRAIILLQGRGRVIKRDPNPYVSAFRRGASIISYNLYLKENLSVPVTPIAIFGTQKPFFVPGKIKVNIGEPMYVHDYLSTGFGDTVEKFRKAMEKQVKSLFFEILKSEDF